MISVVGMIERLKAVAPVKSLATSVTVPRRGDLGDLAAVSVWVAVWPAPSLERDGAGGNVAVDARQRDRNLRGAGPASRVGRAQCQSRARIRRGVEREGLVGRRRRCCRYRRSARPTP